jgi:hypothetical protein
MSNDSTQTTVSHSSVTAPMSRPAEKELVDAQTCISRIFPNPKSAPSLRTFREWQARKWIPFRKVGKRVFFDPEEVRRVIDKRFTVHAIENP